MHGLPWLIALPGSCSSALPARPALHTASPSAYPCCPSLHPQDLEYLISKAVNPKTADYAVVTGVQIHNWASDLDDPKIPSMEFVAPARAYVVVNGEKIDLDLQQVRPGCCCGCGVVYLAVCCCWFCTVFAACCVMAAAECPAVPLFQKHCCCCCRLGATALHSPLHSYPSFHLAASPACC